MSRQENCCLIPPKPRSFTRSASRWPVLLSTNHHRKAWMPYCGCSRCGRGYCRGKAVRVGAGAVCVVGAGVLVDGGEAKPQPAAAARRTAAASRLKRPPIAFTACKTLPPRHEDMKKNAFEGEGRGAQHSGRTRG